MPQLGGNPGTLGARSEGGVAVAEYSVKARPLFFGVMGLVAPFVMGSEDMTGSIGIETCPRVGIQGESIDGRWGYLESREILASDSFFFAEAGP